MTNPILQEINGLSPGAKAALLSAHQGAGAAPRPVNAGTTPPRLEAPSQGAPPPMMHIPDAPGAHLSTIHPAAAPDLTPAPPPMTLPASASSGAAPSIPAPNAPSVIAPKGTIQGDENERGRLLSTGSGVHQIKNPFLRGLAGVGNAIGTIATPGLMPLIPGTEEHHSLLLGKNAANIGNDLGIANKEATTAELRAKAPFEEAQTENLLHPKDEFTALPTSSGIESFSRNTGSATPVAGANGQPLMPFMKPGNAQHVVLEDPAHPGQPMIGFVDPVSRVTTDTQGRVIPNPKPFEKLGNIQAKTLQLPNGQQVAGKVDTQGNLLLEDGSPAPKGTKLYQQPNYGELILPTKTEKKLAPDGLEHLYGYDERTQQYDIDQGAAPTGQAAHQIFQGSAIETLAPEVIADINAHRDILGNMSSYYKQWLAGTPISDPNAAQLMAELMSLAAMQPALHAFRSTSALDAFEKMVGGLSKNPDSTIATINGLLKTPEAFTSLPNHATQPNSVKESGPAVGTIKEYRGVKYKFMGGDQYDQKNWVRQ